MNALTTPVMDWISDPVDDLAEYLAKFDYPIFDIIKTIFLVFMTVALYRAALYILQRCHDYLTVELRRDVYGLGRDPWAAMPIIARRWWKKSWEMVLANIFMTLLVLACVCAFGLIGCIFPLIFTYVPTYWGKLQAVAALVRVHQSDHEQSEPATPLTPIQPPPQKIPPGRKPEGAGYVYVKDRRKHRPEERKAREPKIEKVKGKDVHFGTPKALENDANAPPSSENELSSPRTNEPSPTAQRSNRRCNKPAGECLLALYDNQALRTLAKEREKSIRRWKEEKIADTDIMVLGFETEIKSLNNRLQAEIFQREHEEDVSKEKLNVDGASLSATREQQFKKMLKQTRSDKENAERHLAQLEQAMSELKEGKTASELRKQLQIQTEAAAQCRAELIAEQARSASHREQKERAEAQLHSRESELSSEIHFLRYQLRAEEARCANLEEHGVSAQPTTPNKEAKDQPAPQTPETTTPVSEMGKLKSQLQAEQKKSRNLEKRLGRKQSSTDQQTSKLAAQEQEIKRLKRELKKEQSKSVAPGEIQELREKLSTSKSQWKTTNEKLNATKEMLRTALDRQTEAENIVKELRKQQEASNRLGTQSTPEVQTPNNPPQGTANGQACENEGVSKQAGNVTHDVSNVLEGCDNTNFEDTSMQEVAEHDANEVIHTNATLTVSQCTNNESATPGTVPTAKKLENCSEATKSLEAPADRTTCEPSIAPQISQQTPDDFGEVSFSELLEDAMQDRSDMEVPQIQAEFSTQIENPVVEQTTSQQRQDLQSQEAHLQLGQFIFKQPQSGQSQTQESHSMRFPTQVIPLENFQPQRAHSSIFNLDSQQPQQAQQAQQPQSRIFNLDFLQHQPQETQSQQAQPPVFHFNFQPTQSQQSEAQSSHAVQFQATQSDSTLTPAQQEMLKATEELKDYVRREEERQIEEMSNDLELALQAQENMKSNEGEKLEAIRIRNQQIMDEAKRIQEAEAEEEKQDRLNTETEKMQRLHARRQKAKEKKAQEEGKKEVTEPDSSDAEKEQQKEERNLTTLLLRAIEEQDKLDQAAAQLLELKAGQTHPDETQPIKAPPTHAQSTQAQSTQAQSTLTQVEEIRPVSPTNIVLTGRRKVQGTVAELRKEQRTEAMRQAGNQVDQGCRFEQFRDRRAGGSWHRWEPYLPQKLIMHNWHGLIDSRESLRQTAREFQELAEEFEVGYTGDMSLFGSDNAEQATLGSDNAE